MANGDASSSDLAPSVTNRPALQQFRKQKEQAAVEGTGHVIMVKNIFLQDTVGNPEGGKIHVAFSCLFAQPFHGAGFGSSCSLKELAIIMWRQCG